MGRHHCEEMENGPTGSSFAGLQAAEVSRDVGEETSEDRSRSVSSPCLLGLEAEVAQKMARPPISS